MKDLDKKMEMGYNESLGNSSRVRVPSPTEETPMMVVRNTNNNINKNVNIFRGTFRECLKNHAINNGGHALDGCCEFLPAGPEGSLDALKCAACNCHRNFHRKDAPLPPNAVTVAAPVPATVIPPGDTYPPYNTHRHQAAPPPQYTVCNFPKGLLHATTPSSGGGGGPYALSLISPAGGGGGGEDHDDAMDLDNGGIGSSSNSKKRFRTKFTPKQKEKMKVFAEKLDWRIHKQDDVVVQKFCNENGVKRQVLKVWMNNNKHTISKKP